MLCPCQDERTYDTGMCFTRLSGLHHHPAGRRCAPSLCIIITHASYQMVTHCLCPLACKIEAMLMSNLNRIFLCSLTHFKKNQKQKQHYCICIWEARLLLYLQTSIVFSVLSVSHFVLVSHKKKQKKTGFIYK